MTKNEFLFELGQRLTGLPKEDIVASLDYYAELIDDHIEDGMSEEEAVDSLGNIDDIVAQILGEIPLQKIVKEKIKPKHRLRAWEIVLLAVGSPIWFTLLLVAFSVVLTLAITVFAVMISFFAIDFSLAAVGLGLLVVAPFLFIDGAVAAGLAFIGCALVLLGCAPLLFLPLRMLTKLIFILIKKTVLLIKRCFVGKEAAK